MKVPWCTSKSFIGAWCSLEKLSGSGPCPAKSYSSHCWQNSNLLFQGCIHSWLISIHTEREINQKNRAKSCVWIHPTIVIYSSVKVSERLSKGAFFLAQALDIFVMWELATRCQHKSSVGPFLSLPLQWHNPGRKLMANGIHIPQLSQIVQYLGIFAGLTWNLCVVNSGEKA